MVGFKPSSAGSIVRFSTTSATTVNDLTTVERAGKSLRRDTKAREERKNLDSNKSFFRFARIERRLSEECINSRRRQNLEKVRKKNSECMIEED